MDRHMPDTSRVTVFDDLPELIIAQDIFQRLPSKDILRCGAVSKSWCGATTTKEFLLDHHTRQPSLPLVVFRHETNSRIRAVDAFDVRQAPAERCPVLGFNDCSHGQTFRIEASCDGLLLLCLLHGRFCIVNPATRQWLALPRLAGAHGNIAGMYPHAHRSDEYRILFWRGERQVRNAGYYVLTVGSSQKPKYLGPPADSDFMKAAMLAGVRQWYPPVLFKGCLHWDQYCGTGSRRRILVFDTMEESFRNISFPSTARGTPVLLEVEGMLAVRCLDNNEGVMKIWVLHDYEKQVWSLKCQIELPMVKYWGGTLMSDKRDMLIYYARPCLHQLHYDDNGKLLEEFQWETSDADITEHWYKESLIRHTFFPSRSGYRVRKARLFRML